MSQEKALVFISHIAQEKELAIAFKELIENSFLGMIEVFVSSDHDSISMGQKWLDQITEALNTCAVEIVVCSPNSVSRPWINFEAGAGWIRDIPVIPLCHSGIEPARLPTPLNLLQAAKANEISSLKLVFPVLASAIRANTPAIDFTEFVDTVKEFESRYTFWDHCNAALDVLVRLDPKILASLYKNEPHRLDLTESKVNELSTFTNFLESNEILKLVGTGDVMIGPGVQHGYMLEPLSRLSEILKDDHCALKY